MGDASVNDNLLSAAVKLSPGWEDRTDKSAEELNFRKTQIQDVTLPIDRCNLFVYKHDDHQNIYSTVHMCVCIHGSISSLSLPPSESLPPSLPSSHPPSDSNIITCHVIVGK